MAMSKFQVIGIDEAGRGPLAGPVVSAAVILDHKTRFLDIQDSKKLKPKDREYLFEKIKELAVGYTIAEIESEEIDRINILEATKLSMKKAAISLVNKLHIENPHFLVDGNATFCKKSSVETIIKGDGKIRSIGAASILAKVYRDRLMTAFSKTYPEYGFEKHMGYPTKNHRTQIEIYGPTLIHRKTFKGVKEFL
jgi:ribonuclease HII